MCCLPKIRMLVWSSNVESQTVSLFGLPFSAYTHNVCVCLSCKTFLYIYAMYQTTLCPHRDVQLEYFSNIELVFFFLKYFSNFQVYSRICAQDISSRIRLSMSIRLFNMCVCAECTQCLDYTLYRLHCVVLKFLDKISVCFFYYYYFLCFPRHLLYQLLNSYQHLSNCFLVLLRCFIFE